MQIARLVIGLLSGLLLLAGEGQQPKVLVDRLHGFKVRLSEGWSVSVIDRLPVFHKQHCYIVVGAMPYKQGLKEVAQQLMRGIETIQSGKPKLAFRSIPQGVQIAGEGLDYPYALNPNIILSLSPLPTRFNLVGLILKGEKIALTLLFLFPENTPQSIRKEMVELIRSLEFLPASQLVKWKPVTLRDSVLGMTIATLHVPEGYQVEGGPFRQGTKYFYRYEIKQDDFICRIDAIDLISQSLSTSFGANANTILTYNGKSVQLPQAVQVSSAEDAAQILLSLWQAETDREWRVKDRQVREQDVFAPPVPLLQPSQQQSWSIRLVAESGELERTANCLVNVVNSGQVDYVAATSLHQTGILARVAQYPKQKRESFEGIAAGIFHSVQVNVQWSLAALEEFTRTNQQINQMVREMLDQHREFNSQMARAWSNALSDQTYIRDSNTGEIFKVHKRVWDTDQFWRDPTFGDIIGTIGKETKLGELLREKGWKVMDESLSGFP